MRWTYDSGHSTMLRVRSCCQPSLACPPRSGSRARGDRTTGTSTTTPNNSNSSSSNNTNSVGGSGTGGGKSKEITPEERASKANQKHHVRLEVRARLGARACACREHGGRVGQGFRLACNGCILKVVSRHQLFCPRILPETFRGGKL